MFNWELIFDIRWYQRHRFRFDKLLTYSHHSLFCQNQLICVLFTRQSHFFHSILNNGGIFSRSARLFLRSLVTRVNKPHFCLCKSNKSKMLLEVCQYFFLFFFFYWRFCVCSKIYSATKSIWTLLIDRDRWKSVCLFI